MIEEYERFITLRASCLKLKAAIFLKGAAMFSMKSVGYIEFRMHRASFDSWTAGFGLNLSQMPNAAVITQNGQSVLRTFLHFIVT